MVCNSLYRPLLGGLVFSTGVNVIYVCVCEMAFVLTTLPFIVMLRSAYGVSANARLSEA